MAMVLLDVKAMSAMANYLLCCLSEIHSSHGMHACVLA